MNVGQMAKDLLKAISEADDKKVKPYDTKAEVLRDDGDIVWVKIPGGVDETPVQKTNNANIGDTVMVRIADGKAWVAGNNTSPATDDTRANIAYDVGTAAGAAANRAIDEAGRAMVAADQAEVEARRAKAAADAADEQAQKAFEAADYATYSLSLLEDIVGTLNWISQHGVYVVSTDTTVVPNKTYYTLAGTAITSPTGNPSENAYYELAGNVYVLSSDTVVDTSKTYYQVTATAVIDPTGDPSTNPYYELQIDEAITQYINTHLSLTDAGLRVTDGSQASVLINSTDGVSIWNGNKQLAQYGEGAIIGDKNDYHIEIVNNRLSFKNGNNEEIAYMTNNELYIPRVVVVDSMQIGAWIWDAISTEYHLTLKWKGVN